LWEHLLAEQDRFLAQEDSFRGAGYDWPRDALRNWSRVWEYPYVHHHIAAEIERLGRRARVVDVGSGVTFFPFVNARLGCDVVCVDYDPVCIRDLEKAIAVVDAAPGTVSARKSDGTDVPVDDGSADILVSVSVLEHVDDKPALCAAMAKALRPGGLCVLTMDLDLRGDFEIDPGGRREILGVLDRYFEPAARVVGVHPRELLLSTNGPYGFAVPPAWSLMRFRAKQWLRSVFGMGAKPLYPFELAVEAFVLRRR
jgi:SAM-dependent methyltransferase